MTETHRAVAIIPAGDIGASEAFYARLGFRLESDYGDYRILADGRGGHLHLNLTEGWPRNVEDSPLGVYLYVDDVDAAADRVRELIHRAGRTAPQALGDLRVLHQRPEWDAGEGG